MGAVGGDEIDDRGRVLDVLRKVCPARIGFQIGSPEILVELPTRLVQRRNAGVATAFRSQPQAVKTGDLLIASAQMACDHNGLAASATADPRQPYFGSSAEAQAEVIIDKFEAICAKAGTSLANVARVLQFHTDIKEFYPVYKVWERRLGGRPLPFSAGEVPAPLPVPGATVMIEAWFYAP